MGHLLKGLTVSFLKTKQNKTSFLTTLIMTAFPFHIPRNQDSCDPKEEL